MYIQLRGTDAQGNEVDRWDCSVAQLPTLLLEVAKFSRGTQAAVESARNEAVNSQDKLVDTLVAIEQHKARRESPKLLEVKNADVRELSP